jgi:citrate lyase subunit beta/citryl-CoA lyase
VRINSEPDRVRLDAEAACRAGADGLLVPKARDPAAIAALADDLSAIEQAAGRKPMSLVPMIEDPGAVLDARTIATASPRVVALMTGGEDLATALGAEPTPEVLRVPKLMVHLAAKAAGIRSFGLLRTVADYNDLAGIEQSAHEARRFGFDGASCVHPAVVPILNRAFSPTAAELDHARALIAAFERAQAAGDGAFAFEGRMVDEPVVRRARALIEKA